MTVRYNFSENVQRGILFLFKEDKDFFIEATSLIRSTYFDLDIQKAIFEVTSEYFEKYKKLPSDDMLLEGLKDKELEGETEQGLKNELDKINALNRKSVYHKEAYIDLVEEFAKEREIKDAIIDSITFLEKRDYGAIEERIKQALRLSRIIDLGSKYKDIESRWDEFYSDSAIVDRLTTGFPSFDLPLHGGLARGEMGLIVANSGVGKSLFLVRQALYASLRGFNTLYVTLEMAEHSVASRLDTMVSKMPYKDIVANKEEFLRRISGVKKALKGDITFKQFPSLQSNPNKIRAFLEQLQNTRDIKYDLLIVDYLELLRPSAAELPEYQAQQRIAQELRGIAVEYDTVLWTATQANRQGTNVPFVTETELADSFGKIRETDYAYSINQTDVERKEGEARLYVIKSRNARARYHIPVDINYNSLDIKESERSEEKEEEE